MNNKKIDPALLAELGDLEELLNDTLSEIDSQIEQNTSTIKPSQNQLNEPNQVNNIDKSTTDSNKPSNWGSNKEELLNEVEKKLELEIKKSKHKQYSKKDWEDDEI